MGNPVHAPALLITDIKIAALNGDLNQIFSAIHN